MKFEIHTVQGTIEVQKQSNWNVRSSVPNMSKFLFYKFIRPVSLRKFKDNFSLHIATFELNISWPSERDLVLKK